MSESVEAQQTPIVITEDGGVSKVILKEGEGEFPEWKDQVDVLYKGTLLDGTVFDSSEDPDEPFQFELGTDGIIKGWNEGVKTMKKGEKALFTLAPEYAYGASGSPPKIPPNSTLQFEITLLDFDKKEPSKWDHSPEERIPLAEGFKQQGNEAFKNGQIDEAIKLYEKVIDYIDMVNGPGVKELGVSVNNNLALIYTNSKKYSKAVQHAKDALVHDSEDVKAHFRLGTALEHQGELQLALDSYKKALSIDPNNTAVKKSLAGVSTKIKNKLEQEKKLYQNMFSSTTLYEAPPSAKEHDPSNPVVYLDISIGSQEPERVEIELFQHQVPKTAKNFLTLCTNHLSETPKLASNGQPLSYKGSIFHRNINEFMLQGGDFTNANGTGGESIYGAKFPDENFVNQHTGRGILSMANSGPGTNGSQFFICYKDTTWLNGKHVVFGKVVKNLKFLDKLEAVKTNGQDVPEEEIKIVDCGQIEKPSKGHHHHEHGPNCNHDH